MTECLRQSPLLRLKVGLTLSRRNVYPFEVLRDVKFIVCESAATPVYDLSAQSETLGLTSGLNITASPNF